MANTAQKVKSDSVSTAKVGRSRKAAKPGLLRLGADQRVDIDEVLSMDPALVQDIAEAFGRNRLPEADAARMPERAEAARERMKELLSATPVTLSGQDTRLSRKAIHWPQREFDAVLENRIRDLVRETLNEMLAGETGSKLTAGLKRMVRREVEQMIALDRAG